MLRHALRVTVMAFAVFVVCIAPGFAISKDFDQNYPLQPGGSFELQNVNGTVEVDGWDRDAVEVHAIKTAKVKEADLDRVSIEVDAKPSAVSVITGIHKMKVWKSPSNMLSMCRTEPASSTSAP
jgi:hypothetical protein